MGDFFQNGEITTIHRFDTTTIEKIEHGIEKYAIHGLLRLFCRRRPLN